MVCHYFLGEEMTDRNFRTFHAEVGVEGAVSGYNVGIGVRSDVVVRRPSATTT
jgi:hypothetical protein